MANQNTIESHYNRDQYNTIFHAAEMNTAQENVAQNFESHETPYTSEIGGMSIVCSMEEPTAL